MMVFYSLPMLKIWLCYCIIDNKRSLQNLENKLHNFYNKSMWFLWIMHSVIAIAKQSANHRYVEYLSWICCHFTFLYNTFPLSVVAVLDTQKKLDVFRKVSGFLLKLPGNHPDTAGNCPNVLKYWLLVFLAAACVNILSKIYQVS